MRRTRRRDPAILFPFLRSPTQPIDIKANHSAEIGLPKMRCLVSLMTCCHNYWSFRKWSSYYASINASEVNVTVGSYIITYVCTPLLLFVSVHSASTSSVVVARHPPLAVHIRYLCVSLCFLNECLPTSVALLLAVLCGVSCEGC